MGHLLSTGYDWFLDQVMKVYGETVTNLLNKKGNKFLHSCKKELLKPKDLKEKLKFSRKIKGIFKKNIRTEEIWFYLDWVGYQHKYDPFDETKSVKSTTWWQQSVGLDSLCTAKGSHIGSGGRIAHFIVAISFDKGVILCEQSEADLGLLQHARWISLR